MKKAFTLLEVMISITIFMIVLLFLYKALDQTKHSNKIFATKKEYIKDINYLSNVILEDVLERVKKDKDSEKDKSSKKDKNKDKILKIESKFDKNKNSIVQFQTINTYHNIDFTYITYLVGANNKLVRIESKKKFTFEKAPYNFYETSNSYIDILLDNIEYFEYNKGVFVIKQKNKEKIIIKTFDLEDEKEKKKGK